MMRGPFSIRPSGRGFIIVGEGNCVFVNRIFVWRYEVSCAECARAESAAMLGSRHHRCVGCRRWLTKTMAGWVAP